MRQKQSQAEYFVSLVDKAKNLPILAVIGTLEQVYNSSRQPVCEQDLYELNHGTFLALCPFHADENLGSFVITPQKNMWWCFTEGVGWSTIHFEMRYFNLDFEKAVFHLAKRFSLMTEEEEKEYGKGSVDVDVVNHIEKKMKERKGDGDVKKKAPEDVIRIVYNLIPEICGLKEKHRKHLRRVRMIPEESLNDFFSVPTKRFDLAKALFRAYATQIAGRAIKELSTEEKRTLENDPRLIRLKENLIYVPGFYYDGKKIAFVSFQGIGFIVRDEKGNPQGIQIRRDTVKEGESRYIWFSSSFARYKTGYKGGSSPGAPGGVVYPKKSNGRMPAVCITEGRFKAEAIAAKGNVAIYVSGVSSWKNIIHMVERLKEPYQYIYVMFDADLMGNTAVHGQLSSMCEAIRKLGRKPILVLWRIKDGKGFDDLVFINGNNNYTQKLHYMTYARFEEVYRSSLWLTLQQVGAADIRDVKKEERKKFNKLMQSNVEDAACEETTQ